MSLNVKESIVASVALAIVLVAFVFAFNGASSESSLVVDKKQESAVALAPVPKANEIAVAADPIVAPVESIPAPAIPVESNPYFFPEESLTSVPNLTPQPALARTPAKAPRPATKNFSCAGQICIDAETGIVLSERNAKVRHAPASVTKLMTLFLVLDAVERKEIRLTTPVVASRRAQETGGTQVYLAEGEVNTVEDLLYALMLQSANDAAVALAEKISGNVDAFVERMNQKARELGLTQTKFSTPHGLPLSKKELAEGKRTDMSSAFDLANLSLALIRRHPFVFRYSAAKTKMFRDGRLNVSPLPMGNHNTLLRLFPGCDGLKTGWTNAGASIVTTASRGNRRVIAVVLGGIVPGAKGGVDAKSSQRERNQRAAELMFDGLRKIDALKYEPTPEQI